MSRKTRPAVVALSDRFFGQVGGSQRRRYERVTIDESGWVHCADRNEETSAPDEVSYPPWAVRAINWDV